jgi:hypothetical protein
MFDKQLHRLTIAVLTLVILVGPFTCSMDRCWQSVQAEIVPLQLQVTDGGDPFPLPPLPRPWSASLLAV